MLFYKYTGVPLQPDDQYGKHRTAPGIFDFCFKQQMPTLQGRFYLQRKKFIQIDVCC